jgi:hypothetical protein
LKLCYLQENGTRDHQVKQNKLAWERKISQVLSHMWNLAIKNKWQECKTGSVWEKVSAGGGGMKRGGEGRMNVIEFLNTLYTCMKIEW